MRLLNEITKARCLMLKNRRRPRRSIAVLVASLTVTAVCIATLSVSAQASPSEVLSLKVAVGTTVADPIAAELWVAAEKGYYKKEGVDPEITPVPGAVTAISMMQSGQSDAVVATPDALPAANLQGASLLAVHTLWYSPIFSFAFFNPSGSECTSLSTLKGCKIGVANLGSSAIPMLASVLKSVGLTKDDVTIIPIGAPPAQALSAIQAKRIDLTLISSINLAFLKYHGVKFTQKAMPGLARNFPGFSVNTSRANLVNPTKRKAITAFLRAISRAQKFCTSSPVKCASVYEQNVNDGTDVGLIALMIKARRPAMALPAKAKGKFGWSWPSYWKTLVDVEYDGGMIKERVNPTSLFTNTLVSAVNKGISTPPKKQKK